MTENRRIFWNIVATYARSLYALIVGLLCGRWALMALGEVDYGLNGLVGGLTVFISFFNDLMAGAISRFYAFSVGAAEVAEDKKQALEECRKWFNIAVGVHAVIPLALIIVGYPLGSYAIEHWLTIPTDRIAACHNVFIFVCISCFVGMINAPFTAMYRAKQYIAELTIYGFVTSTINVVILHYMVTHPGDWLTWFAAWSCLLFVVPQLIICIRAYMIFPECRIRIAYLWNLHYIKKLGGFAGWQFLGGLCALLRTNGMTIVVNKFFGARMNAAQAIGNTVQGHCNSLANAMQGAFIPVITQSCGANDVKKMNAFVMRASKFSVLLSVIFMIPLALELPEVMTLWLKTPPAYTVGLCYFAMIIYLVDSSTTGHMTAVNATGKIAMYHVVLCSINIFSVPLAVIVGIVSHSIYAIMTSVVVMQALNSVGRIYFARKHAGTSVREWLCRVATPLTLVLAIAILFGFLPQMFMRPSFGRVCATTLISECILLPMSWLFLLSGNERQFIKSHLIQKLRLGKKAR